MILPLSMTHRHLDRIRTLAAVLLLVGVGGCQRVGVVESPAPPPVPEVQGPVIPESAGPAGPVRGVPLVPLDVETELDPILHSGVASDAWLEGRVAFWVDFWTSRGAATFARYLERMALYEGLVERELEDRGLPRSLKYLPIVESGYHDLAVSRVGATGLWQLMAPTAGGLGLTVNAVVDDRRDAVASTRAALDYLVEMYGMFDSWFLALAAYNAGPGRVRGVLNRHSPGLDVLDDQVYLALRAQLPAETREFVPRFLAAARLARSPEAYGFGRPEGVEPLAFDEVMVPDATSLDVVAWAAGVDEDAIRALNPHYLRGFTPAGQARAVRVPPGTGPRFEVAYASLPPEERVSFMEHAVARGETLGGIAGRYGVRLADLQAANGNVNPRRLQVGQRLVVPVAGGRRPSQSSRVAEAEAQAQAGSAAAAAAVAPEPALANEETRGDDAVAEPTSSNPPAGDGGSEVRRHQVRSGESLWVVARTYGVTVDELERWNGLGAGRVLQVGEELVIGEGGRIRLHTVVAGDTWGALARRYGVSATALAQANGRSVRQVIRVGESLRIP